MRDLEADTLIIIPNATLAAATVTNYGGAGATLASVVLSLPLDADLEIAERTALDELRLLIGESAHAASASEPVLRFQGMIEERFTLLLAAKARSDADVAALTHDIVKRVVPRIRATTFANRGRFPD
jgi:hypothetical protein